MVIVRKCAHNNILLEIILYLMLFEILVALGENQTVIECENGEIGQTHKLTGFDLEG
jgi:hypothetical protein